MTDVAELFERVAEQGSAQARPPALASLRRRAARRSSARAGVTALAGVAGVAAALVLVPQRTGPSPDVVVADAAPSTAASPVPVPPGQVALPPWAAEQLRLPSGTPPVADQVSSYPTEDGPLVTAARRDGSRLCWAVFTAGEPGAPSAGAACDLVTLPAYRSGALDLGAASEGRSSAEAVEWLVLRGSAPAGTRTVVATAAGGASERIAVTGAGPDHLDRAWFALPWVQQDTEVSALDAGGRVLARGELLLGPASD